MDISMNVVAPEKPSYFDLIKNYFVNIGNNKTNNQGEQPYGVNNDNNDSHIGGARSRRRKCNKKHRHTKSCRKNVKKGRKTRKH
jgi:hypothetical protein